MHTSVLNSRVILIVRKRVQQTVLDCWRRKGLRGNNRWRLRTKCISQVNCSVTWANTMPTLVINCRVVLIYSIVRLICHDEVVYEEITFGKPSSCIKSIEFSFAKWQDLQKTNLGDNQTFYQVNVESSMRDFSLYLAFSFTFMNLRQQKWRKCFQKWSQPWKFNEAYEAWH